MFANNDPTQLLEIDRFFSQIVRGTRFSEHSRKFLKANLITTVLKIASLIRFACDKADVEFQITCPNFQT